MNVRRMAGGAGVGLRAPKRGAIALALTALALAIWMGLLAGAEARQALRAADHHATVVNGRIMGSAFAIGRGVALTNAHVVQGLRPGGAVTLYGRDGRAGVRGVVVGVSRRMDLAVLRMPDDFLPPVSPQDVSGRTGLEVRGAGVDASGGPNAGARLELSGSIVDPRADLGAFGPGLVVRMPGVRPGFSGGPVLDARGRLVGMIAAIRAGAARQAAPASGYAPMRARPADEAYVLRAADIRGEAARLVAAAGK